MPDDHDPADRDRALEELPETEPHWPPIFDTGPHPQPLPVFSASAGSPPGGDDEAAAQPAPSRRPAALAEPAAVPGHYHFLRRWKLVMVLAAVWIPAAGVGLGLFSWWYSLIDKTPAAFAVLVYAVVCTVAGLMMAMVQDKPLVSAFAIALISAVFASAVAATPLYGYRYCQVKSPCVAGIIPY